MVEEDEALHGDQIVPGDVLLGYASTGLHTNGYTLARRIVFERLELKLDDHARPRPGDRWPTCCSRCTGATCRAVRPVLGQVHGLAHITGGGIARQPGAGAARRTASDGGDRTLGPCRRSSAFLQQAGEWSSDEMRDVFNLGVGMIAVLPADAVDRRRARRRAWPASRPGSSARCVGRARESVRRVR